MANRLPVIAVIAAIVLYLAYSSVFVVNARQQAIVLRFGEIVEVKSDPGIYFKLPFAMFDADTVQMVEKRVLRFDLDNIRVQVSGGKFYEVDAFVAYRISDPRTFRQAVSGSVELAEQRLRTRLDAALRRVYGVRGFEAALSEERAAMMREVADQLRPDATSLGLQIEDVRIPPDDRIVCELMKTRAHRVAVRGVSIGPGKNGILRLELAAAWCRGLLPACSAPSALASALRQVHVAAREFFAPEHSMRAY